MLRNIFIQLIKYRYPALSNSEIRLEIAYISMQTGIPNLVSQLWPLNII